jgi:aryl-alcohol dehydrogenase-like predicted oxidoreductase
LREGITKSLERLQLDYVDIVFAHRFDNKTPLEEICRGFNEIIEDGKAFYWGTSDWDPAEIYQAFTIC